MATDDSPPAARRLDEILKGEPQHSIDEDPLAAWDKGVFINELQRRGIVLSISPQGALNGELAADEGIGEGTYDGTQMALTEMYSRLEDA